MAGYKLIVGAVLVAAAIGYLAYVGAASSWQYYLTVDEAASDSSRLTGMHIRVSGRIAPGSLTIGEDRRRATFVLTGEQRALHTICQCALPDNLCENKEVVVEGTLNEDDLVGHKVITRCASKYESSKDDHEKLASSENRS